MSAIAGIWHMDGQPVADHLTQAIADQSRPAGPDGGGIVTPIPGLMMQTHLLHFDRLSAAERQPYVFARGSVVTWDGRLDNRDDLLISLHYDLGPDVSDAALVAAAYERWGVDALARLIGDWSLAIWDAGQRTIILARDYMGNRALYYMALPNGLAWATRLDALVEAYELYSQPDENYVIGVLTQTKRPGETPFRSIRRLGSCHYLAFNQHGTTVRRYWTFTPNPIHFRSPQASIDRLRELMVESVRVRMRATRTVWSELSGGFDSSSVACIANALIQQRLVEAPSLRTVTIRTGSPESDETAYVQAVEERCGFLTTPCNFVGAPTMSQALNTLRPADLRVQLKKELSGPVRAAGGRVLLTGSMGDLVLLRSGEARIALLEPLHRGRPLETLRLCIARARHMHNPLSILFFELLKDAYLPTRVRTLLTRRPTPRDVEEDFGLTPGLLKEVPDRDLGTAPHVSEFPLLQRSFLNAIHSLIALGEPTSPDDIVDVRWTDPYSHRPLIEFLLVTPILATWNPVSVRSGMKLAMEGILPPRILNRVDKGRYAASRTRIQRELVGDFIANQAALGPVKNWQLVRRGYLNEGFASQVVANLGTVDKHASRVLNEWVPLEAWLQSLARRAGAANLHRGTPVPV